MSLQNLSGLAFYKRGAARQYLGREGSILSRACPERSRRVEGKVDLVQEEWLFLRCEADGTCGCALSNMPVDAPLKTSALGRSLRTFAEGTSQDARSGGRGGTPANSGPGSLWLSDTCFIGHAPPGVTGRLSAEIVVQSEI
jgi:hypothetical protein